MGAQAHEERRGGTALVEQLAREGVEVVFGLPGVHLMTVLDAFHERAGTIRFVTTRHEQATGFMADGYARVTGRPGTTLVVPGPGIYNAGTGIATAYAASSPVLQLAGQVDLAGIGLGNSLAHEVHDQLDLVRPITKRAERVTRAVLRGRERITSAKSNLAVTAALEHFTATLAELLLRDEDFRRSAGHQAVQDLFVWHALEEAEHKAVAFDVYRAVGGTERMRIRTMKVIRKGFVADMVFQVTLSVLMDRATYRRGNLRKSLRRFKTSPFLRKELREQLRAYDRVGFHPDDIDTDDLVAEWREKLFGDDGSLNVLLRCSGSGRGAVLDQQADW